MSIAPGTRLGRYEIRSPLGAGGMGEVYLAEDTKLRRKVAIKFLPPGSIASEQANKRLLREARAAAALDHPHICGIHEVGEEAGQSFIVMQYVEGETLDCRMKRQPLGFHEGLTIATQVADALSEAHWHGIVHRDIKPSNIMITSRGAVKVMDFGLAKIIKKARGVESEAETEALLSTPGAILGTIPYMSPEQVRGEALDGRSDIFSFGVVLYEMLSGQQPFASESVAATASAILTREPPPLARYLREVPAELERIVCKALRKDREERYQTAKDLLIDLRRLKQQLEVEIERSAQLADGSNGAAGMGSGQRALAETVIEAAARQTVNTQPLAGRLRQYKKMALVALAALVMAIAVVIYFRGAGLGGGAAIDSLAVLPFVNAGGDPDAEYLSDGISESLINSLSQLPNVKVMSRNSVFRYKGRETDAQAVGRVLGVRAVLAGRVMQRGDGLSISTELVDARDNSHLWGEQYNRKLTDILAVQEEIAREISTKLRSRLTGEEQKRVTKRYTENTEAYQLYLKGRYHLNRLTDEGFMKGREYFQQAIDRDPNYALAYAGLADSYNMLGGWNALAPKEVFPKARAAAMKALELDDTLAEAHTALGTIKLFYDWDWSGAERAFKRAVEINQSYADAHLMYGYYLSAMGRFDEALARMRRAQELDPLTLAKVAGIGDVLYYQRQYDRAIEQYQKTLEMDPNSGFAYWSLGNVYVQKGMYEQAIAEYQKAIPLSGDSPDELASLGYAYALSGRRREAQ